MKVNKVQPDIDNPDSIIEQQTGMIQVIDGLIEFGDPIDPFDPANAGRAGANDTSHPGTTSNIHGSWVEIEIDTEGPNIKVCNHNLYLADDNSTYTIPVAGEPNVRWLVFGWMHDGNSGDDNSTLDCYVSFLGDTVLTNSIELVFDVVTGGAAPLLVDGTHPVLCTLFFTRASRM